MKLQLTDFLLNLVMHNFTFLKTHTKRMNHSIEVEKYVCNLYKLVNKDTLFSCEIFIEFIMRIAILLILDKLTKNLVRDLRNIKNTNKIWKYQFVTRKYIIKLLKNLWYQEDSDKKLKAYKQTTRYLHNDF